MRTLIILALMLWSPFTVAAEWGHYVNERFGVAADVPPGFTPGAAPANGDGLVFSTPTAELRVYGAFSVDLGFEDAVRQEIGWREGEGWAISYQAITPSWASYSGKKGGRILYVRDISMCGGDVIGAFALEYSVADLKTFDPIVARLVRSLTDSGTGWQCKN